jgi:hypothetical protein
MSVFLVLAESLTGAAALLHNTAVEGSLDEGVAKAVPVSKCKRIEDGKQCEFQCGCVWSGELQECFDEPWTAYAIAATLLVVVSVNVWVYVRAYPWLLEFWGAFPAARLVYLCSAAFAAACALYMWSETVYNGFYARRAAQYRWGEYALLVGALAYPLAVYAYQQSYPDMWGGAYPALFLLVLAGGAAAVGYVHLRALRDSGKVRDYGNMVAPYYVFFHVACVEMLVWCAVFWRLK